MGKGWEGFEEAIAIADTGSFVGAAVLMGTSTSHVSRVVARLEERLDVRVFNRTTRRVALTDRGRVLVERFRSMVDERDEMLMLLAGDGEPQGGLRITCPVALGERFVAPVVRRFTAAHPRLAVVLDLTNRVVDVVGEGYDLAVRTGQMADDRLAGRRIASRPVHTCASPDYLEQAGDPRSIDALAEHQCLIGTSSTWRFLEDGASRAVRPDGRWRCNSGTAVVDAALAGMGICHLPAFYVADHLASGRLRCVLEAFRSEPEVVWAAYPVRRQLLPKIRNLVDQLELALTAKLGSA